MYPHNTVKIAIFAIRIRNPIQYGAIHTRSRSPGQQPEKRYRRHPTRQVRSNHRIVRVRQIIAGVRHIVCRRAAALRGKPVGLCTPVSRPHVKARLRFHNRPPASHSHTAACGTAQPAFHSGYHHRDIRLPATAVRKDWQDILSRKRN